jgi:hypothetical protein
MERFGTTENGLRIAKRLRNMVGTRRLELPTSTVQILLLNTVNDLTRLLGTAKYLIIRGSRNSSGCHHG